MAHNSRYAQTDSLRASAPSGSQPFISLYNVKSDHPSVSQFQVPTQVTIDRQGASRDVADLNGKTWRVREMDMAEGNGLAKRKSLIALNDMIIRRFWIFPAGWRELTDRALLALINGPARPRPESFEEALK